jgi:hypothetical protein
MESVNQRQDKTLKVLQQIIQLILGREKRDSFGAGSFCQLDVSSAAEKPT